MIPVTENSQVLDMVLRFCYPVTVGPPPWKCGRHKGGVLEVSVRYGVEEVEGRVQNIA